MMTSLSSRLPESHTLSLATILLRSIKYIALAIAGGAIGTSIPWFFLKNKTVIQPALLIKDRGGWLDILPLHPLVVPPAIAVDVSALALATVAFAFSLRRFFPVIAETDQGKPPDGYTSDLPNLYGTIALGIRLAGSSSIGEPSQYLGERSILSSKAAQIPLSRPPVEEVLRLPIPRPTTIHRFDEITIVFLSARERARGGANVSIQSFTLIPR